MPRAPPPCAPRSAHRARRDVRARLSALRRRRPRRDSRGTRRRYRKWRCARFVLVHAGDCGLPFAPSENNIREVLMNRALFLGSIALAFAAGCGATRLLPQAAIAADTMMTAQVLHVPDLSGDALGLPSGTGFRSKTFVMADGMTLSVQAGNVPKHMHPNTNELQYILEGTGTI